jgi:formate/nitrite transporter FocA (FNT family)
MLLIPLYFQVTKNSSPAEAGAYLVPSVIGNTIGGLLSGSYVKRSVDSIKAEDLLMNIGLADTSLF